MDLFYGTYLTFLIKNTVQTSTSGLTIKEIEESLHIYPTARERRNFRNRIRQALKSLYDCNEVVRQETKGERNLILHKYASNDQKEVQH